MKPHSLAALTLMAAALFSSSAVAHAQAVPAAVRPIRAQVGAGFSFAKPDYGSVYVKGFTVYGDATLYHRIGVEADVHYNSVRTPTDIGENTFMVGPTVSLVHEGWMNFYAKALGGFGRFQYQEGTFSSPNPNSPPHTDTVAAYAIGGGIDLRASKHVNIRAVDIEQQWWPGYGAHGLAPFVTTFGAAYTF